MNHLHCNIYSRDEYFIRDIRAGGIHAETAISCLYLKYRKRVYSYFEALITKHDEFKGQSEDLVHDAFIVMIDKIREEDHPIKSLAGFWIGIGKHLFLNQLKKDQRTVLVNDPETIYETHEVLSMWIAADHDEDEQLQTAISYLCERCREILLLWIDRYSMTEIAQMMKLTNVAMARKTKYECFKKLKEIVKSGHIPGV